MSEPRFTTLTPETMTADQTRVASLAEWLDFQAGIWHEITTWYGWSSTPFSERPSAFSPEDLYSNLVGLKIAGGGHPSARFGQ